MDKYEYRLKAEQIEKLFKRELTNIKFQQIILQKALESELKELKKMFFAKILPQANMF